MTKATQLKTEPFTRQDLLMFSRSNDYTFNIINKGVKQLFLKNT